MEPLAEEPIDLEYETDSRYIWDQVFLTADAAGCLESGNRNGISYEVINVEEPSTSDDEDPKAVTISRFTNRPYVGVTICTSSDEQNTDKNHFLEFFPNPESNRSTLLEPDQRNIHHMTDTEKRQFDLILASLAKKVEPDLRMFGNNFKVISFESLPERGLLKGIDILEVISSRPKQIELFGGKNRQFELLVEVNSGWKITREVISFAAENKYSVLPMRKITVANLRLRRAIIES